MLTPFLEAVPVQAVGDLVEGVHLPDRHEFVDEDVLRVLGGRVEVPCGGTELLAVPGGGEAVAGAVVVADHFAVGSVQVEGHPRSVARGPLPENLP